MYMKQFIISSSFDENNNNNNIQTHEQIKLNFILNAIERGWSVKKKGKTYIFSKCHKNNNKYFEDTYLDIFIQKGLYT